MVWRRRGRRRPSCRRRSRRGDGRAVSGGARRQHATVHILGRYSAAASSPGDGAAARGRGEAVNEVVLLDTFHPGTSGRDVSWRDHFDGMVGEGSGVPAPTSGVPGAALFVWARHDRRLRRHLGRGEAVPHELREWHLATTFLEALKKYVPARTRARDPVPRPGSGPCNTHVGARLGWSETLLPRLELFEVPGGHDSLVREPNVLVLASGLDEGSARMAEILRPVSRTCRSRWG